MSNIKDKIVSLTKQLFPTGRGFNFKEGGIKDRLFKTLADSETRAYNDATSILYSILPDNDFFTVDDATRWEERLGLITNDLVSLADRKAAIIRKMNHPGNIRARQSWDYVQSQLQLAGFNVFVYENIPEQDPGTVFGPGVSGIAEHSVVVEHMETGMEHGQLELWSDVVANSVNWGDDQYFNIGLNSRSVFYICGNTLGTFADIPAARRIEFRQIILRLKPVQTIAYLGINYI